MAKLTEQKMNDILGTNEVKEYKTFLRQLFAECYGTFIYLALALLSETNVPSTQIGIAFAHGILIASVIQMIGHISGGFLNPAVTVGMMVIGVIKPLRAVCYVAAQILGAIAGAAVAYHVTTHLTRGTLSAVHPHEELKVAQVFGIEFLMTFVLVSVTITVVDPRRHFVSIGSAPLAIGLCLTGCLCAGQNYSGSLNPVRCIGPAVIMNIWSKHWVYWTAPLSAGLVSGLIYKYIFPINNEALETN